MGASSSAHKKYKKRVFFDAARFWKFVWPFYRDVTKSRVAWRNVQTKILCFLMKKLPVPILVWRCKILFFLLSSFFVCFLGPVPCFSNDAQLRPRVFYLIFRARCGCTSHFFLCAKNAKNRLSEILALLYTNHTNLSSFFSRPGGQIVAWLQRLHHRKISPRITAPNRRPPGTSSLACRRWSFGSGQGKLKKTN